MRISTRGRYALRAMVDLAMHLEEGPVSRRELAARQEISAPYVAQLFRKLIAAGLARGVKGPGGGYMLARPPEEIRAGDVVRAVEGPIALVRCITPATKCPCDRIDSCVTHLLWKRLSEEVEGILDSVTIEDLREQATALSGKGAAA